MPTTDFGHLSEIYIFIGEPPCKQKYHCPCTYLPLTTVIPVETFNFCLYILYIFVVLPYNSHLRTSDTYKSVSNLIIKSLKRIRRLQKEFILKYTLGLCILFVLVETRPISSPTISLISHP